MSGTALGALGTKGDGTQAPCATRLGPFHAKDQFLREANGERCVPELHLQSQDLSHVE